MERLCCGKTAWTETGTPEGNVNRSVGLYGTVFQVALLYCFLLPIILNKNTTCNNFKNCAELQFI
jgi:hypothetical protein